MNTYLKQAVERVRLLHPFARIVAQDDLTNNPSDEVIIHVFNVEDNLEFFVGMLAIHEEILWPNDITNVVFLPHSVEDTCKYYPQYAIHSIDIPYSVVAFTSGSISAWLQVDKPSIPMDCGKKASESCSYNTTLLVPYGDPEDSQDLYGMAA